MGPWRILGTRKLAIRRFYYREGGGIDIPTDEEMQDLSVIGAKKNRINETEVEVPQSLSLVELLVLDNGKEGILGGRRCSHHKGKGCIANRRNQ